MRIKSLAYAAHTDTTTVSVQNVTALTESVNLLSNTYEISFSGRYDFDSPDIFEVIVEKLAEAGVDVMPF